MEIQAYVIVIVTLALLNLIQFVTTQVDKKRQVQRENWLIKAALAKSVQELAHAEESPDQGIKRMKIENDLAVKAAELQQGENSGSIPII